MSKVGDPQHSIPDGWKWKRLSEIILTPISGGRPKGGASSESGTIPSIGGEHITKGGLLDFSSAKYIPKNYFEKIKFSKLEPGDILICKDGALAGKVAFYGKNYFHQAAVNEHVFILRPKNEDSAKYLFFSLQSEDGQNQIKRILTGSAQPGLTKTFPDYYILKMPSHFEQHKIAAILSSVDAAIEQTDAIIAQTERMKTGLMQELFAKKFDIAKLGDCSFKPEYGYTTSAIFQPVGPKFIRITDLKDDGVDWASVPHCTCDEYVLKKYLLKPGDIIFARIGATTGKNYLIKENINCIFASYLIRIRCKDMLLPDFLYQFLKTSAYWNQINANKSGRLKEGINIPLLNGILIPLPSIQEQKKISLILSSIDERLDGEKKYRERLKKLKLGLMQDLLNGRVRVKVDGNV